MRSILIGNYGVANLGDDALKDYFLSAFPEIEWTVLSAHPGKRELPRLPAGIRSFLSTPWWKTVQAIRRADAVVFGGGTLFTDIESPLACTLWFLHVRVARFFGVPYFLAFQGVGPFRTGRGKRLAVSAFRHAAFVSVRDEKSAARVQEMGVNIKCVRTFDPVILHIQKRHSERSKNMINVIPRHNSGPAFFEAFRILKAEYPEAETSVLLMQPDDAGEQAVGTKLLEMCQGQAVIVPVRSMEDLCDRLAGSLCTLTERYHGALAALTLQVSVRIVSQADGDKLSELRPYAENSSAFSAAVTLARIGEAALRDALNP